MSGFFFLLPQKQSITNRLRISTWTPRQANWKGFRRFRNLYHPHSYLNQQTLINMTVFQRHLMASHTIREEINTTVSASRSTQHLHTGGPSGFEPAMVTRGHCTDHQRSCKSQIAHNSPSHLRDSGSQNHRRIHWSHSAVVTSISQVPYWLELSTKRFIFNLVIFNVTGHTTAYVKLLMSRSVSAC